MGKSTARPAPRLARSTRPGVCVLGALAVVLALPVGSGAADGPPAEDRELKAQLEALLQQNRDLARQVEALREEVRAARAEARAARELAEAAGGAPADGAGAGPDSAAEPGAESGPATTAGRPAPSPAPSPPRAAAPAPGRRADPSGALLAQPLGGGTTLQLLDLSLDVVTVAGGSSAEDEVLELLQGGGHDPRRRGFSLPSVELSFLGAVDPWFRGEVHLLTFLDAEGESRFEVEEAFATTSQLPFGLEEHGLELEVGHMRTEFGRLNPLHVHAWTWLDQPVVSTRFFGEDGLRAPGVRAGWMLPLPWYSELHLGAQSAKGETMASFLASDEAFEERPVGGRPFASAGTRSLGDLVTLARWVNGFELSDTWTGQLGISGLLGPNATGSDGRTWIYGTDLALTWRPLTAHRGFPFVRFEAELMGRRYEADDFRGCPEEPDCADPLFLDDATLRDWGGYAQVLWGFRRGWALGLRGELAGGSGDSVRVFASRSDDPFRDDRLRISPLLSWMPSEFSRLRLQYNFDRADFLDDDVAHSVWLGLELLFGAHPAHTF